MPTDPAATAAFYDSVGIRYEESFGHDQGFLQFIKSSLDLLPLHATVLDIGCGTGKPTSAEIIARGHKAFGIDVSPVMVELSKKQVPQGKFELVDMREFSPESPFDAAFANFSLFHITPEEVRPVVENFAKWIVPGGCLFVSIMVADDFNLESSEVDEEGLFARGIKHTFMGKQVTNMLYTKNGWEAILSQVGFKIVKTEMIPFQAPPEAECDMEPHYYITARKGIS